MPPTSYPPGPQRLPYHQMTTSFTTITRRAAQTKTHRSATVGTRPALPAEPQSAPQTHKQTVRSRSRAPGGEQHAKQAGLSSRAHLSLRCHELCCQLRRVQLRQVSLPLGHLELRQELLRKLSKREGYPQSRRQSDRGLTEDQREPVACNVSRRFDVRAGGWGQGAALTVCISATSSTADRTADAAERTTLAACGETGDGSASFCRSACRVASNWYSASTARASAS